MAGLGLVSGGGSSTGLRGGVAPPSYASGPSIIGGSTPGPAQPQQITGASIAGLLGGKAPQQAINPANLPGGANYIQQQKDAAKGNTVAQGILNGTMPIANTVGPAQFHGAGSATGGANGLPSWATPTASQPGSAPAATPAAAPAAPATPGAQTNTAAPNPVSNEIIDTLKARAKGDMGLPGELDRATQKIRDNASLGIAGEQQMSRIRRGVSGDSAEDFDNQQLADSQQRDINSVTTDLTLGRERDRDSLLKDTAGLGLAQGSQQLQGASQATQAQALANQDQRAREAEARMKESDNWSRQAAADAAMRQSQMASFSALLNLLS